MKLNEKLIAYICSVIIAAVSITAFMFNTFQTRDDSNKEIGDIKSHFEKRLDRIDEKLDRLIEKKL